MVAAAEELKELSAEAPAFSDVSLFSASAFGPEWPAGFSGPGIREPLSWRVEMSLGAAVISRLD